MDRLTEALKRTGIASETVKDDGEEMIEQLKEKFRTTTQKGDQLQILSVLPKSWSVKKLQEDFCVTSYMARQSKTLVKEKGILSLLDPKRGPSQPLQTVQLVCEFYQSDEVSRVMPGKKDFASVKEQGNRIHVQKRLMLGNLKEVYHEFKSQFPNEKIGFSRFAALRPKQCILAGAAGTHCVFVCTIHQNVKLMLHTVQSHLTELATYHHCLARIMCNPPSPSCCLGECPVCPDTCLLKDEIVASLDKSDIDEIVFKQWVSTDRSTLETFCLSAEDFVDCLCEKLEALRPHSFIAKQQAAFFSSCKTSLKVGEILMNADFSENYSFVLQDASQGFHWNNTQATIHPFIAYYLESDEVHQLSYVVISDCLHHDVIAVYTFIKRFIDFLRKFFPIHTQPSKILYFSDGSAPQYKNHKNFLNLCLHQADFGLSAEWHFSATSHGKGACDGLEGSLK